MKLKKKEQNGVCVVCYLYKKGKGREDVWVGVYSDLTGYLWTYTHETKNPIASREK